MLKISDCGATDTKTIAASGQHQVTNGQTLERATCTTPGSMTGTCTICGTSGVTVEIPATGHDWSNEITQILMPTCEMDGENGHRCIVCGEEEVTEIIPASGHSLNGEIRHTFEPIEGTDNILISHIALCQNGDCSGKLMAEWGLSSNGTNEDGMPIYPEVIYCNVCGDSIPLEL